MKWVQEGVELCVENNPIKEHCCEGSSKVKWQWEGDGIGDV